MDGEGILFSICMTCTFALLIILLFFPQILPDAEPIPVRNHITMGQQYIMGIPALLAWVHLFYRIIKEKVANFKNRKKKNHE